MTWSETSRLRPKASGTTVKVPGDGLLISIDGPAGSGKSTLATSLGKRLGLDVLDTGAMYRAAALLVIQHGIDATYTSTSDEKVSSLIRGCSIEVGGEVLLDGIDVTSAIRTQEVDMAVSGIAAIPDVRLELVARQRSWIDAHNGGVVEGRDIGTVVAPDADLKVFLVASDEVRIARRAAERGMPADSSLSGVVQGLIGRDRMDSARQVGALPDAARMRTLEREDNVLVVDSTSAPAATVLDTVVAKMKEMRLIDAV